MPVVFTFKKRGVIIIGMKNNAPSSRPSESGSALIYIFICVFLFAALTYAVSNMGRTGDASKNRELSSLGASEILQ